jgi:hypothetical protein
VARVVDLSHAISLFFREPSDHGNLLGQYRSPCDMRLVDTAPEDLGRELRVDRHDDVLDTIERGRRRSEPASHRLERA